jgi:hypothetical protein
MQSLDSATGSHQVIWTVDADKLKSHERQAVSPAFDMALEPPNLVSFRLVLSPRPNPDGKGSASFRKANGWGSVQLKCEASSGRVSFLVSISNGRPDFQRQPRGPVKHDFAWHSTCGLPRDQEHWDFNKAVDRKSHTFAVCLDLTALAPDADATATASNDLGGEAS